MKKNEKKLAQSDTTYGKSAYLCNVLEQLIVLQI